MQEFTYEKMRGKKRFDVHLNATYGIKGQDRPHKECQITNLSSSGAKVRFPRTENLMSGAIIAVDIPIPNTSMRITTEAEVIWTKQRFNELISGIKFSGVLSDSMFQEVVNRIPQLSDYSELIW